MIKKLAASLLLGLLLFSTACGIVSPPPPHIDVVLPLVEIPRDIIPGAKEEVEVILISNDTYEAFKVYMDLSTKIDHKQFESNLINQYEMDFIMEFDMYVDWMSFSSGEMEGNVKMVVDGDNFEYAMVIDMGNMGVMEVYFDGTEGLYYIDGELIPMAFDDLSDMLDSTINMPEFTDQAIKSADIYQVGENIQYVIILDGKYLSDFVRESMINQFPELGIDFEYNVEDVEIVILTDAEGIPINLSMLMVTTLESDGIETATRIKVSYDIIVWGVGVNIEMPSA